MKNKKFELPHIGQRMIKSAVAVFFCYLVDILRSGTPFYSALASIQCMQPYKASSKAMAKQRIEGTLIGAFYGLIVILIELKYLNTLENSAIWSYAFVALFVVAVLYTTVVLNKKSASYFSCVVYLSIAMIHITDTDPYLFVFNRVADTFIGLAIGMTINKISLPRKTNKETLFVTALDSVLIDPKNQLLDYSKVELNRLIDDGVNFSIMTMRTPASFLEAAKGINLKLPAIVMNGAALYDIQNNHYIKTHDIPQDNAKNLHAFITSQGHNSFMSTIEESSVMIQYENLANEGEKAVYKKLRKSPYRNYTKKDAGEFSYKNVIYFMVMDETSRIVHLAKVLKKNGFDEFFEIIQYKSTDYPNFSYLKVYDKGVSKQNMLEYLKEHLNISESCSIGSVEGGYDIVVSENVNSNHVVQMIKNMASPVCVFGKNNKKEQNKAL
ncbi:MAG: HAD hydrolase family protein [Bacillota bacterium]